MKEDHDVIVLTPTDIEQQDVTMARAVPFNRSAKPLPFNPNAKAVPKKGVSGIRVLEYVMAIALVCAVIVGLSTVLKNDNKGQAGGIIANENAFVEFAPFAPSEPDPTCKFDANVIDVRGDGSLLLRQAVNEVSVTVQLAYADEGWMGFAFSESASMVPNIAVLGLPDEGTVLKYNLGGKSVSAVVALPEDRQTLSNVSIIQQDGKTVLTFTKPRFEDGEVAISPGNTQILWALGGGNSLAVHAQRGSASFAFTSCVGEDDKDAAIDEDDNDAAIDAGDDEEKPINSAPDAPVDGCPFHDVVADIRNDKSLVMRHVVNEEDATVRIQVEYDGEAWIGISLTDSTSMVPNVAIIGLPDEGTVRKYNLGGKSMPDIAELDAEFQTLQDASILQQDGRTVMTFTKRLSEEGEVVVSTGQTNFLWAVGPGNDLAQHAFRGSSSVVLTGCPAKGAPATLNPIASAATTAPTESPIASATKPPTRAPTKAPTKAPITAQPTSAPIKSAVTDAPTKVNGQYIDLPDPEQAYSKVGNRRSCNYDSCPSGAWAAPKNLGTGCECTNGLNSCYWDGQPTTLVYYPKLELVPTQWTGVYKLQSSGSERNFGRGGDTASGIDCFDDPLKGGFKVDLSNTDYFFDDRSVVKMFGSSPSMKVWADSKVFEDRRYGVDGASLQWSIPAGAQSVKAVCGGWPAECWSDLYVYEKIPSVGY